MAKENNFTNDKKLNAAYWDLIDTEITDCVSHICDLAVNIDKVGRLSDDDISDIVFSEGVGTDFRDALIEALEKRGLEFPYVEGNL